MASPIAYQNKYALIIGINKYPRNPLHYCINDAIDLQDTLERINFNVSLIVDCNYNEFVAAVKTFAEKIRRGDLVLFYFAGHGKQKNDENYLFPSDYDYDYQGDERDYIVNHAISVKYIMKRINDRKHRVAIYLFDCCRKLVRTRATNMNDGISFASAISESLIVYTCAPDGAVQDETRNNRNGSFMENLLRYIVTPNKGIEEIMTDVGRDVKHQTRGFQLVQRASSLTDKVFLVVDDDQG